MSQLNSLPPQHARLRWRAPHAHGYRGLESRARSHVPSSSSLSCQPHLVSTSHRHQLPVDPGLPRLLIPFAHPTFPNLKSELKNFRWFAHSQTTPARQVQCEGGSNLSRLNTPPPPQDPMYCGACVPAGVWQVMLSEHRGSGRGEKRLVTHSSSPHMLPIWVLVLFAEGAEKEQREGCSEIRADARRSSGGASWLLWGCFLHD